MPTCEVHWRPSGGRGEFEFVPAHSLADKRISLLFEPLGVTIPAEVVGVIAQGKPRLRKDEANNRQKLHLCALVMAVARLPDYAREDLTGTVSFPLENKAFVIDTMFFDIIEDDDEEVLLSPLRVTIRNSTFELNLADRLLAIANDISNLAAIEAKHPDLAEAIEAHSDEVQKGHNSGAIRTTANAVIELQRKLFGATNAGSAFEVEKAESLPPVEYEESITGKEGRILTRIHTYKERDRSLSTKAKAAFKKKHGKLFCEACKMDPVATYGVPGESCIEVHHKIPIEQLQPDSITDIRDMAIVCASCHRIIHSQRPCLAVEEVRP